MNNFSNSNKLSKLIDIGISLSKEKNIKILLEKHKRIFAKDIGRLGPEFQVRGYINEKSKMNIQRPGHSPFQDDMLVAVMKQCLACLGIHFPHIVVVIE